MAKWFSADAFSTKKARKVLGTNLRVLRFEICGNITLHILPRSIFILFSRNYKLEMAIFPRNPGPEPATPPHNFGWAQHQAQHSFLGPASGPAVYRLSIRPLMLSLWRAQQPHVRPIKKNHVPSRYLVIPLSIANCDFCSVLIGTHAFRCVLN